jgi:hypothetical protein
MTSAVMQVMRMEQFQILLIVLTTGSLFALPNMNASRPPE